MSIVQQALVVLHASDPWLDAPALAGFARGLGLLPEAAADAGHPGTRRHWTRAGGAATIERMTATYDAAMACNYLTLEGPVRDGVVQAVAAAYAQLPVRMPQALADDAVAHWRDDPASLQRAALAVTSDTETSLAQAIAMALRHTDAAVWETAAAAAALMPKACARQILGDAAKDVPDAVRRERLAELLLVVDSW